MWTSVSPWNMLCLHTVCLLAGELLQTWKLLTKESLTLKSEKQSKPALQTWGPEAQQTQPSMMGRMFCPCSALEGLGAPGEAKTILPLDSELKLFQQHSSSWCYRQHPSYYHQFAHRDVELKVEEQRLNKTQVALHYLVCFSHCLWNIQQCLKMLWAFLYLFCWCSSLKHQQSQWLGVTQGHVICTGFPYAPKAPRHLLHPGK